MQTVCFKGLITTLSPLSHNSDENVGTDTKFRRLKLFVGEKDIEVPVYSGNAFRGIFRRVAMRHFCDTLGLKEISDGLYYTLFCGGALQKGSSQDYIEVGRKRELRAMIPPISLLGTAVQNQVIPGKLQIGLAVPISAETEHVTGHKSPVSIWSVIEEIFYTRRDDLEDKGKNGKAEEVAPAQEEAEPDIEEMIEEGKKKAAQKPKKKEKQAQQMKYTIECLAAGVRLAHEIVVQQANEVEMACFSNTMQTMQETGILGGKSGVGHGKVLLTYTPAWSNRQPYLDFLADRKKEVIEYVRSLETKI